MVPANVVLPASPKLSVFAPSATWLPATPDSAPMVWLAPALLMSKMPPALLSVTAPVAARLPPVPIASPPALIVVPPV